MYCGSADQKPLFDSSTITKRLATSTMRLSNTSSTISSLATGGNNSSTANTPITNKNTGILKLFIFFFNSLTWNPTSTWTSHIILFPHNSSGSNAALCLLCVACFYFENIFLFGFINFGLVYFKLHFLKQYFLSILIYIYSFFLLLCFDVDLFKFEY